MSRQFFDDLGVLHMFLEAVSVTTAVIPWGVASLDSRSMLFCWDSRSDASEAILGTIVPQVSNAGELMTR